MYKCLLHATDLQENHLIYCEQAQELAKSLQAELFFIHVLNLPASWQLAQGLGFAENAPQSSEDAQLILNIIGEQFKLTPDHLFVRTGGYKQSLLDCIDLIQADLLILGSSHPAHLIRGEFSQISHDLTANGLCDVLIMHEK